MEGPASDRPEKRRSRNVSDRLFSALADRQRRRLLAALGEHVPNDQGESFTLDVDGIERTGGFSRVELHHVHLPVLSDVDVIEWNRESDEITAGPRFDEARQLLGLTRGSRDTASAE